MSRHTGTKRVFALLVVATLVGCRDQPAGPELPDAGTPDPEASFFAFEPAPGFEILRFTNGQELFKSTVRATIGPEGGVIELDDDLTVYFPSGALTEPTQISVRPSSAGGLAYEFAPHGIRFNEPVVLRFELKGTEAEYLLDKKKKGKKKKGKKGDEDEDEDEDEDDDEGKKGFGRPLNNVKGVYFRSDPQIGNVPLETLPVFLDDEELVILIRHFSGYAVASG